jgi:hypothetical protein
MVVMRTLTNQLNHVSQGEATKQLAMLLEYWYKVVLQFAQFVYDPF